MSARQGRRGARRRRRGARLRARWLRGTLPLAVVVSLLALGWLHDNADRPLVWLGLALAAAAALAVLVWWVRGRIRLAGDRRVVARTDLSAVDRMTGVRFEEYVASLLRSHGYTRVTVVGGSFDGGADLRAQTPDGRPLVVQCKRWRRPVPPNEVRAFLGVLAGTHRGYLGMFVASDGFTEAAAWEAGDEMVLVGRDELALWMSGTRPPELPRPSSHHPR
ncbi:restriction system protein [Nocardiopsis terrae]|uniref:Restriction system protein n=1 Tax=Nocardiopsis terrae TaxID=372655 RepID=A0ABR9HFN3_9ACTN|nr:restriction system protein [Nocardiopsis terrae]